MKDKLRFVFRFMTFFLFNWRGQRKISLIKTIYYNFFLFPFYIAIRFPLFIHSGVKTYKMGKIRIEGEIKRGMIAIGTYNLKSQGVSKILNKGEIVFKGPVILGGATIIENSGLIVFEGETVVGEGNTFLIHKKLIIGKYTRIGFRCLWTDSDYHYMIHVESGEVRSNKKEIVIGKCNWIASCTTVKKGTNTPDYTIVASNSLLSKDYRAVLPPYSIIGGLPAKMITTGYRRIYNMTEERKLNLYFSNNDKSSFTVDLKDINMEAFCTNDALKFDA